MQPITKPTITPAQLGRILAAQIEKEEADLTVEQRTELREALLARLGIPFGGVQRRTYCPGTTAENAQEIQVGHLAVCFSYHTPVAFRSFGGQCTHAIRENDWGPTTGKHLNAASESLFIDREDEVESGAFYKALRRAAVGL